MKSRDAQPTPVASTIAPIAIGWSDPHYANLLSANLAKGYA
jgi:hypothetical protein